MSDRASQIKLTDSNDLEINPATEDKQDDIIANQTNWTQKTGIVINGSDVSIQNPFSTDGDTIYEKDINVSSSSVGTFTGNIVDLFNTYWADILTDSSATNPKTFTITFNRPVVTNEIGFASTSGDFSNVKILLQDTSDVTRVTIDDSANNTKFTGNIYQFVKTTFIKAVIEFHTSDAVALSSSIIPKIQSRSISAIDGYISETNSSTLTLTSGSVFTGTAVDTLNYGMIVVSLKSDQASATDGLSVEFSIDGTNWDHTDIFTIAANTGKTFTFQTVARFMRVIYTNGGVNQTFFRLQTTLKPVYVKPSSHRIKDSISGEDDGELVKAIITGENPGGSFVNFKSTTAGNFKVSLEELENAISVNNNSQLRITPFNSRWNEIVQPLTAFWDLRTGELSPQFQGSFEYTVDNTDLMTQTLANGGTVTQASGMGIVTTSTTTASMAMLTSKQHARYKSWLGGLLRFTALFTAWVAATEQFVWLQDETGSSVAFKNGYALWFDGTTFGYHRFQNDTLITTALANWDDPLDGTGASGATIDITKLNVFFIQYQYLWAGAIKIFFEVPNWDVVLVNTDQYAGANTEPSVHNPNFFFHMHVDNKATTSNLIIKSSSYAYFVEGKTRFIELHQPQNSSWIKTKNTVTTEIAIFTIRNKTTYASKTNFIDVFIENITASIEASSANNLGSVRLVKNATLGGAPSFNSINTTNSVVEIDTAGTTVTWGNEFITTTLAGKNDKAWLDLTTLDTILNPWESITLAGTSANSATINWALLWKELF